MIDSPDLSDPLGREARIGSVTTFGVASDEGPSALADEADVMVEGTDGVRDLLRALLA